ncbi:hypothetical protein K2173_022999 [Erythroxylum novogranatense]|uniref:RRM domain-containing protein n=1 Tax=Erythroxylum novogranatense TaxID=1862640 RepID=A0AAV8T9H9_9ROSI|nr:hypothetical protein K2173_022999 [Erythroxylum novogranatense]
MTDGYWNRQQQALLQPAAILKRQRTDYDLPHSGLASMEMPSYYPKEDDRARYQPVKDTKTIGSAYDRYLQTAQVSPFSSGEVSALNRIVSAKAVSGMSALPIADAIMDHSRASATDIAANGRDIGYGGLPSVDTVARPSRETVPLPPDASNTLYVEGLPPDSTRREVAHIFRPFVGYKELRLVTKDSKLRGGDPIILCFVDFESPACAATAMSALQGYKMDEHDPDSNYLRLQFSRHPGPRSGPGSRGKR